MLPQQTQNLGNQCGGRLAAARARMQPGLDGWLRLTRARRRRDWTFNQAQTQNVGAGIERQKPLGGRRRSVCLRV